jgi:tetratricopeptide (TPR) repeat protein
LKDVFVIQDEIAQHIVQVLRFALGPRELNISLKPTTDDVQAYDYYLRGRKFFYQLTRRSLEFARQMFVKASQIDPSYALAYAGIADCCSFMCMWFQRGEDYLRQADTASLRALELAPDLAEAHASRGLALSLNRKYEASAAQFEIAIQQDPRLFEAYYFYARDSVAQGKLEQAARLFQRASDVRPEDYQSLLLLSQTYRGLGRGEEARAAALRGIEVAARHLELDPEDTRALYLGAAAKVVYGQREEGLEWAERAAKLDPEESGMLYQMACIYALAGESTRAIDCLEEWERKGAVLKEWLLNDSDLDSLRSHPRFQTLVGRPP